MTHSRSTRFGALLFAASLLAIACSSSGATTAPAGGATAAPGTPAPSTALSGTVTIDGSSTVYPITEAVAEEFQKANKDVKVTVAFAGTGGGFKKFCNGETDANDASRPIKNDETEAGACAAKGITPVELGIATDGLSVLVNPQNTWVECLTTAQLKQIWDAGSPKEIKWSDVNPAWPAEVIKRFGPGADSGTFDYFTEVINGKAKQSTSDFTQSEDDNTLVQGIAGDKNSLGYFGFAYYEENQDKLKLVGVDSGKGCVKPSNETIVGGTYTPLSRPLFVYPSVEALKKPEVAAFFTYYLDNVNTFVEETGYIDATPETLATSKANLAAGIAGTYQAPPVPTPSP